MLGIGCDYCAYCFDEALLLRDRMAQFAATKQAELEADREAQRVALRRDMGIA